MDHQSLEQFLDCIERSGLVEKDRLAEAVSTIQATYSDTLSDCDKFAERLIEAGLLTQWQTQNLRVGKRAGFFLGHYKLLARLGSGGSSSVYLGEHIVVLVLRAIKVLPYSKAENASCVARFLHEVTAGARVDQATIRKAFDTGQQKKHRYLVLEYIEGRDLRTIVKAHRPVEFRAAVDFIRQAAEALAHMHERGVIHRDVKPSHLMVDKHGTVKLLDLSLARFVGESAAPLSAADAESVWGTLDYLALEQTLDIELVNPRTDIYSLGCTLYFLLMGRPPSGPGPNKVDLADVPRELVEFCSRMMARSPGDRPQTAKEVADWLSDRFPS